MRRIEKIIPRGRPKLAPDRTRKRSAAPTQPGIFVVAGDKVLNRMLESPVALVAALLDWFAANARDLPWRRTRDPYAIWVSEIMLQQTQVKTVIPFWERWLRELPTIEAAAAAPSAKIHKLWE